MANRHSHKKLRAEIRARMAASGESYQAARQRILHRRQRKNEPADLVAATYFGLPITVATFEILSHLRVILVSGGGGLMGLPWGKPSILMVSTRDIQ